MLEKSVSTQPSQIRLSSGSVLTTVLLSVIIVAALYIGRDVFMPIAVAVLLSFMLAPVVRLLRRWYVPRVAAVILVGILTLATLCGLGVLIGVQVAQLASDLPHYQTTLRQKIQSLRGVAAGDGTLERATDVLKGLRREIETPPAQSSSPPGVPLSSTPSGAPPSPTGEPASSSPPGSPAPARPIPVEVKPPEDLRNRFVRLAGAHDLQRTTAALDDAAARLGRLFVTQLVLNMGFGLVIGIGLWFIGVPSAALWGALAMIMRFVPYVGAVISAVFPLGLAAAVGPDWALFLWTGALFIIAEPIAGQVVEPLVYGHSTGLSPMAVITAATFWTWLWGPIGLVLATPLTLCVVVLGRHVDRLNFLNVMFGDEPPLTPAQMVYQRLLARDYVEASEQATSYLKEKSLISYYEDVLLQGLKLAQSDAERGSLNEERMRALHDGVAEIVEDLDEHIDQQMEKPAPTARKDTETGEAPQSPLAKL